MKKKFNISLSSIADVCAVISFIYLALEKILSVVM